MEGLFKILQIPLHTWAYLRRVLGLHHNHQSYWYLQDPSLLVEMALQPVDRGKQKTE